MRRTFNTLVALAVLVQTGSPALAQDHRHLNAGAVGTNPGDKLYFSNGDIFEPASGFVKDLFATGTGAYAGYYAGNITLTALPTTIPNGGPVADAPAPGSFIQVGVVSVSGPEGGHFAFWEHDSTSPTLSFPSGFTSASPTLWALSDALLGAGSVGADPFGHIHGRQFTTTRFGEYTVGFQLFDTSVNGPGGGPIHGASEILTLKFSAVPEPPSWSLVASAIAVGGLYLRGQQRRRAQSRSNER